MTVIELIGHLLTYPNDLPVVILEENGEESREINVVDLDRADRGDTEAVVFLA